MSQGQSKDCIFQLVGPIYSTNTENLYSFNGLNGHEGHPYCSHCLREYTLFARGQLYRANVQPLLSFYRWAQIWVHSHHRWQRRLLWRLHSLWQYIFNTFRRLPMVPDSCLGCSHRSPQCISIVRHSHLQQLYSGPNLH